MQRADVTIIGAGVVGLAVASEIATEGREVYLLEKNDSFGQEQSSRNSEVIHAGIYYEKDSLKAKTCVEGNRLLYELCDKNCIPYRKCGKIIIAVNDLEAEELEKLYQKGRDNGVRLEMLSQKEMHRLEPELRAQSAFLSPDTGIVDAYALMKYYLGQATAKGAQAAYRTKMTGIEKDADGFRVSIKDATGSSVFLTRVLINSAGLYSDEIASMTGIDTVKAGYKILWCKGEYFSVGNGKNRLINRLIYPVPMTISVGVHVCYDVTWRLRLGPLFYYVDKIEYKVDDSRKSLFLGSSIMRALPVIEPDDLTPETSGIMAMLQENKGPFRDFIVKHEYERGLPGFINLVGIESPGLTASPAIASYVSRLVDNVLGR